MTVKEGEPYGFEKGLFREVNKILIHQLAKSRIRGGML